MFKNLLSSGNQNIIGISLTPSIGLEAVKLDFDNQTVLSYGRKKVEYNFSSREPQDYSELKMALVALLDEMQIQQKTPVYFVLPNVLFDFVFVPPALPPEEIKTIILSEAEKFYLFKREEPYFSWAEVVNFDDEQKKLAYSAFQKNVVDAIKEIVNDIGLELVGIESSYSAILRGLRLAGGCEDVIMEQAAWSVMVVNTNSYTIFQLEGNNLITYNEVPIAIKSYSTEEAYDSIVSSSSQLLKNKISEKLYIISQTDDISAEILKRHMDFDNQIVVINSNRHSTKPILDVMQTSDFNVANSMTLAAIGAAIHKKDFGIEINVLNDDPNAMYGIYFTTNLLGMDVEFTQPLVMKICVAFIAFALVAFGGLSAALYSLDNMQKQKIDEVNSQITAIDEQIAQLTKDDNKQEIDITSIIDEVAQDNVSVINFYDSISVDIPKEVWLTKYYNKSGDKIAVRGIAQSIMDIYEYYKNLRIASPQSDIKLRELKVVTLQDEDQSEEGRYLKSLNINKDKDRLYSFEISNVGIDFAEDDKNQNNQPQNQGSRFLKNTDEINIIGSNGAPQGTPPAQPLEQPAQQMVPAN